jgi:hypothetical protein
MREITDLSSSIPLSAHRERGVKEKSPFTLFRASTFFKVGQ